MRKGQTSIILGKNAPAILKISGIILGVVILISVLIFILSKTSAPTSTPEYSAVIKRGVLHVGIRSDIPGFSLNGSGLEVDLARALSLEFFPEKGDSALQLVTIASSMMNAKLSDSTVDFAIMIAPNAKITGQFAYSTPYYTDKCIVATIGTELEGDFSGKTIGIITGSAAAESLSKYKKANELEFTTVAFGTFDLMLKDLKNGKLNAVILENAHFRQYQEAFSLVGGAEIGTVDYSITCSKDSPALAQIASMMLEKMAENGELQQLIVKNGL
ncbi:MAG: transporter substrate-binding domain-containing protein [Clostridia bacterium]